MTAPDPAAVQANAFAIAFRLLGDRPAAQAAIGIAVERTRSAGLLDGDDWLCHLAEATVAASVGAAAEVVGGPQRRPDDADGMRQSLRRRLSSASVDQRVAASLHHLAGYPIDTVAAYMGRPVDEVTFLASIMAPPPGLSYRSLGDPDLLGVESDAPRRWRPRVSVSTLVTALVVVGLVVGVSRCVGPRPRLGAAPPEHPVVVGPDVAAVASSGCSLPAQSAGTFTATAGDGGGTAVTFRLAVPESSVPPPGLSTPASTAPETTAPDSTAPDTGTPEPPAGDAALPRPLVVAVTDVDTDVETFLSTTGLETRATEAGSLVATLAPPPATAGTTTSVADAESVVREVMEHSCVDTSRITVTGHGTGALTATALACERPSIVSVAVGVGGASMPTGCRLSPAVSLLLLWSADDTVLPPTGGRPAPDAATTGPTTVRPSGSLLPADAAGRVTQDWARAIGAPAPSRTTGPDASVVESATAPSGAEVAWVAAPSGGHAWTPATTDAALTFAAEHARKV